jgi:hypothetical protein
VTHLRLTPPEYQSIAAACRERGLARLDFPAFRRLLAAALADCSPALAERVAGLTGGQSLLLRQHLRAGEEGGPPGPAFTAGELGTLAELCGFVPDSIRFAGPVRRLLVRCLRPYSPGLARKLSRLSLSQFERLYEQVRGRGPDDA